MRRSRILSAALVSTLTLGVAGAGVSAALVLATPAGAATARDWTMPTPLTEAGGRNSAQDVRITSDGTAVAVWVRDTGQDSQEVWAATRPAKATTWRAPVRVAVTKGQVHATELTTGPDGSATVAWHHYGDSGYTYSSSTLLAGATAWSPAARVSTVSHPAWMALASGPDGRLVAVWTSFGAPADGDGARGLYVSERSAPGGAWSPPAKLTDILAHTPAATVGPDGTVTVAWHDNSGDGTTLRVTSRAPGATEWPAPRSVEGSSSSLGSDIVLQSSASGATLLSWSEAGDMHRFAYRSTPDAPWGAAESAPWDGRPYESGTPQLGPQGEVTAVWEEYSALRTATRSATGAWSAVHTLDDGGAGKVWSPSVGPDGTVTAVWTASDGDVTSATRTGGAWARPVIVGRVDRYDGEGVVATGAGGQVVVVWNRTTGTTDKDEPLQQVWATVATPGASVPSAPAERRDHVGNDGRPDLYAQTAAGALVIYQGTARGTVSTQADGGTWPAGSTVIPFGDLDGDGSNDTLVHTARGELHHYSPPRGRAVTPDVPHTPIGTGWYGLDAFTYSGDFTADGIPDLVARRTETGELLLHAGTENGTFAEGTRIGSGWKGLTIVGAGDLNNDKKADLLGRTATGDLYRYNGTGAGTIGAGTRIGSGWGGMTDFVGIGDLTGDGNDDILGRHTNGDLYRYNGSGAGTIGAGTKIGSGWKSFAAVR
ncbi:FG-GAP repeat domain-containing protein [Streptomyces sp. NRRL S-118]|uniref:FG-GAP repeat domain-containing protein n=1 Tax=Streptomyces sp. NRRL S-118 TaxID=1463881 RepID=UPI0004C94C27|nr:VCBS repeat-containing protein [Streptomyces sp. NRRL S-118]